jgi:hypothetical protein
MDNLSYTAFLGWVRIATGSINQMLRQVKQMLGDHQPEETLLIFEDQTGKQVDFDLRGTIEEVLERVAPNPPRSGPGRPKLGVASREVSLLPRHWEWLEVQPQGASAALRRLVDEARWNNPGDRAMRDATGRFMTAMAGNMPGFEEAYRALYASEWARLEDLVKDWPADVREYILARGAAPSALA